MVAKGKSYFLART